MTGHFDQVTQAFMNSFNIELVPFYTFLELTWLLFIYTDIYSNYTSKKKLKNIGYSPY